MFYLVGSKLSFLVLLTISYSVSVDCPDVINFGRSLQIHLTQFSIWTALLTDCCTAIGVTCTPQRVTGIDWSNFGLNGTLNGTAIPSGIGDLLLTNNKISGNLPLDLTSVTHFLFLDTNKINGTISSQFYSGLGYLYLNGNQLSGTIPLDIPSSQRIYLSYNQLTGSIPPIFPANCQVLFLQYNQLTGSIPASLPSGLLYLVVQGNQLTGNLPLFPSTVYYMSLGRIGGPGNLLTGTLSLGTPIALYINHNLITNINIQDSSQLNSGNCDISNTPLLGNPNITNLVMCVQNGLYNSTISSTSGLNVFGATSTGTAFFDTAEPSTFGNVKSSSARLTFDSLALLRTTTNKNRNGQSTSTTTGYTGKALLYQTTLISFLKIISRLLVDALVFVKVIQKTPFKRTWKTKTSSKKTKKEFDNIFSK